MAPLQSECTSLKLPQSPRHPTAQVATPHRAAKPAVCTLLEGVLCSPEQVQHCAGGAPDQSHPSGTDPGSTRQWNHSGSHRTGGTGSGISCRLGSPTRPRPPPGRKGRPCRGGLQAGARPVSRQHKACKCQQQEASSITVCWRGRVSRRRCREAAAQSDAGFGECSWKEQHSDRFLVSSPGPGAGVLHCAHTGQCCWQSGLYWTEFVVPQGHGGQGLGVGAAVVVAGVSVLVDSTGVDVATVVVGAAVVVVGAVLEVGTAVLVVGAAAKDGAAQAHDG